ncbi:MAG: GNAT family N-acetyltransferase [Bacteroidota bacterium]
MLTIQKGTKDDLPAIAQLLVETWQSSYQGFMPAKLLKGLSIAKQTMRHQQYFEKGIQYWVVKNDAEVLLGFCSYGPCRNPAMQSPLELYTLYVDTQRQKRGIGSALLQKLVKTVKIEASSIGVSVFQRNPYRSFYQKNGFKTLGEAVIDLGGWQEDSLIMRKIF